MLSSKAPDGADPHTDQHQQLAPRLLSQERAGEDLRQASAGRYYWSKGHRKLLRLDRNISRQTATRFLTNLCPFRTDGVRTAQFVYSLTLRVTC